MSRLHDVITGRTKKHSCRLGKVPFTHLPGRPTFDVLKQKGGRNKP